MWMWTGVTQVLNYVYWNRKEVMDKVNHACLFPFPAQLYPTDKNLLFFNTTNIRALGWALNNTSEKLTAICCLFIQMKIHKTK